MKIDQDIYIYKEHIRNLRRDLHLIPEPGFDLHKTADYVARELDHLGIAYEKGIAQTGLVAVIPGKTRGNAIAYRSDMDALTLTEETGLDFSSTHEGCMHGCGHDGHMATLLTFAKWVKEREDQLERDVVLIFQPAEEGPGGAEPMIEAGVLSKNDVKEIYGLHLYPEVAEGKLAVKPGPMMAKPGEFDIVVTGKSGHGAQPHNCIDPIVIASQLVVAFQSIVSRNLKPLIPAVITVGTISGGERRNIIAESVRLEGTIRAFEEETFTMLYDRMTDICIGFERAYNCTIDRDFRGMYAPVYNDPDLTEAFHTANQVSGDVVESIDPQMIAEDFALFQKEVPGVFFYVGTYNEEKGHTVPLHNVKFNFDEETLLNGVQAYVNVLRHRGGLANG